MTLFQRGVVTTLLGILFAFSIPESSVANSTHHTFGGKTLSIPLKTEMKGCQKIRLQLFGKTSALQVPIGDPSISPCTKLFHIEIPEVRRKTELELEVNLLTSHGWKRTETVKLQVYPQQMLDPIRDWALKHDLVVADSDGKLERFLEENNIPYISNHRKAPKSPAASLILEQSKIHFNEKVEGIPKVLYKPKEVSIEMFFLDELSENPLFQFELIQMFQKVL